MVPPFEPWGTLDMINVQVMDKLTVSVGKRDEILVLTAICCVPTDKFERKC